MKLILATSLIASLAVSTACGKKKVEEKTEEQGQAAKADEKSGDAEGDPKAEPAVQKLTELYPPAIGVYPLTLPDDGRSLYFGFSAGGAQKFEMIWVYAIAVGPDFSKAISEPVFNTQADVDAFMDKWTAEWKELPEKVAEFAKLQTEFGFKVDPAFINDAEYVIPPAALEGQPNWVKATQKLFARRYTTKQAGATTISATFNGVTLTVPVTVTSYVNQGLIDAKTRYDTAANATTPGLSGCIGCHGNASTNRDAFVKHSSDYLAYLSDAEILGIVKTGTYPNGVLMPNNATHKFTFAAPADEANIVGYLRSFPTVIDKLQGVATQPAALRLR